jgi:fatty acid desaturase
MHNLEGILFEEVINDQGISYATYRKTLRPDYARTWLNIGGAILAILLLSGSSWYIETRFPGLFWLTIPLFSIIIGFCIAHVNLFVHEAGHFYIHPDKKTNDILANVFLCSWVGIDIKTYRKIHWQHHLQLATPDDTENSYFNPLSLSFILETLTGIHLVKVMTSKSNKLFLGKDLVRRSRIMLLVGAMINLTILFFAFYTGHWQFAVSWILSMTIFFPFFATIRQISEHRDELASKERQYYTSPKNKISRIFSDSLLSRMFGAAGFNKHMIHHWDPHIPFTALKQAELFLKECARSRPILESSRTTYFTVFKKLLSNHP